MGVTSTLSRTPKSWWGPVQELWSSTSAGRRHRRTRERTSARPTMSMARLCPTTLSSDSPVWPVSLMFYLLTLLYLFFHLVFVSKGFSPVKCLKGIKGILTDSMFDVCDSQGPPCGQKKETKPSQCRRVSPWCWSVGPPLGCPLPSYSGWITVSLSRCNIFALIINKSTPT